MRFVLALLLALSPGRLGAAVVYGNYLPGNTEHPTYRVSANHYDAYAWGLHTDAFSYRVNTVTVRSDTGRGSPHELDLFSGDETGYTGDALFHFAAPLRTPFGWGASIVDEMFEAPGGVLLAPYSTYWFSIRITEGTACDTASCQGMNLIAPTHPVSQGSVQFLGNVIHWPNGTDLPVFTNGSLLVEGEVSGAAPTPEPATNKLFALGMILLAVGGYIRGHHH